MRVYLPLLLALAAHTASGLRLGMGALRMSVQTDEFFASHPESLRLFHPAFPLSILTPITSQEAENIARVKKLVGSDASSALKDYQKLPWLVSSTHPPTFLNPSLCCNPVIL
jgi:hypothetical protein